MIITPLKFKGLFLIDNFVFQDERGLFVKSFNEDFFKGEGIVNTNFKEIYFSISKKETIRGMHFQLPPMQHSKLIYLTQGKILDVVLDLRKDSDTFGEFEALELCANKHSLFIPEGIAHGFKALEDNSLVVYNQTSVYNSGLDSGINFQSFGFDWNCPDPIISDRDRGFIDFKKFNSPF